MTPYKQNENYHRRTVRLPEYDYARGTYFVTICTNHKQPLFGEIKDGVMQTNDIGEIVRKCWLEIPGYFRNVTLDQFIIMPDHVHGIIVINDESVGGVGATSVGVQNFEPLQNKYQHIIPGSVGSIIRGFKTGVTKWCRNHTDVRNIWQRNYYEHIIRDERELNKICRYIINNPPKWEHDLEKLTGLPIEENRKYWDKFLNEFE